MKRLSPEIVSVTGDDTRIIVQLVAGSLAHVVSMPRPVSPRSQLSRVFTPTIVEQLMLEAPTRPSEALVALGQVRDQLHAAQVRSLTT